MMLSNIDDTEFTSYLAPIYHFHLSCRLWALKVQMLYREYYTTTDKWTNVSCCVFFPLLAVRINEGC